MDDVLAVKTLSDLLALVAFILVPIAFIYYQFIQHDKTRKSIISSLRKGKVRQSYQDSVRWLLDKLERFFGPRRSWKAFKIIYLLALLYPFLFFLFAYSYSQGTHLFAGKALLPETTDYHALYFPGFIAYGAVMFGAIKVIGRIKRPVVGTVAAVIVCTGSFYGSAAGAF